MTAISSRDEIAVGQALRRYIVARVAGRTYPAYSRYDQALGCWVISDEAQARGRCDGRHFIQVRRPGFPWCQWLGMDTSISSDHALQAFFELHATEPRDWQHLLKEVTRDKQRTLRDWRQRGRQAIARLTRQAEVGDVRLPSVLAVEFAMPGKGMRSLRN